MTANNNPKQPDIEHVRELLSPYLDGEVSRAEEALIEQTLADSPELRWELETMRQTVSLLNDMPVAPAPRPFTLVEAEEAAPAPWWGWLRIWGAAAAMLVCVLAVGGLLLMSQQQRLATSEIAQAPDMAQEEAGVASTAAPPAESGAAPTPTVAPTLPPPAEQAEPAPMENEATEDRQAVEATEPVLALEAEEEEAETLETELAVEEPEGESPSAMKAVEEEAAEEMALTPTPTPPVALSAPPADDEIGAAGAVPSTASPTVTATATATLTPIPATATPAFDPAAEAESRRLTFLIVGLIGLMILVGLALWLRNKK